ncbi:MAG: aminopeptidase [Anaerolineae bacterium]|nr:aminopeptidase [Anaerolineae bacterium]
MDPRIIAMITAATRPYKKIGVAGETVAIITDTDTDPIIWQTLATAAQSLGIHPVIALMVPSARDYADPPLAVQKMAEAAAIIHYTTRNGLVHSQWGLSLSRLGKKRIVSEGITPEMFTEGAVRASDEEVNAWNKRIQKIWDEGSDVHISTPYGTDLHISIEGHLSFSSAGQQFTSANAELFKAPFVQFPGGETACTPNENTGDGVLVIDQTIHHPPGRLTNPVHLHMEKGRIVKITGGWEADEFRRWLDTYGDDNARVICELAVGTNPYAVFMGNMRQDRFPLGSMHVGFGMNTDVGGTIDSNIHYDGIMSKPTLVVDGETIIKDGVMQITP